MTEDETSLTSSPESAGGGRKLSRRDVLKVGGTAAAALGVAASMGGLASAASAATKPFRYRSAATKTTLIFESWEQFEPAEKGAWFKVVDDFTAQTGIGVTWTGFSADSYTADVITQAQAGNIPADVIICTPELATTLILKYDVGVSLQSIVNELGLDPIPAHDAFKMNGQLYALGVLNVCYALVYDERLLAKAGFSAPPATLDEWLAQTAKLTDKPSQFGCALFNTVASGLTWFNQLQNFPLAYGGVWAKGSTLMLESAPVVNGMKYWLELLNASGLAGSSEAAILKLIFNDQTPLWPQVAAGMTSLKTLAPKLYPNMRSAPFPFPGHKAASRLHPLMVLKTSKNLEAAKEFVKFLITPKNLYYLNKTNGYPIIPFSNFSKFEPGYEPFLKAQPWASGFLQGDFVGEGTLFGEYVFAFSELQQIVLQNMSLAITGTVTVEEAMSKAQSQATEQLAHLL
jgi:ABC-type glycerol-3-phosphate transport system substrate-binding protein